MQKETLKKSLIWAVIASETSHVFCCVFPTLFSLLGLLAGLGISAALPPGIIAFHEIMHRWEIPMIVFSGTVLVLGWTALWYAERVDCHDTGCAHSECTKTKSKAGLVLKIATVLFIFNILIYATVHRSHWFEESAAGQTFLGAHGNADF